MILDELLVLQDESYQKFEAALIPNIPAETVIGVRIPALRQLARRLGESREADEFLTELPHRYFDENQLHALLIENMRKEEKIYWHLEKFLPCVDNWSTCDLCSPKYFQKNPPSAERIGEWISSEHPYTVRFGVNMLMRHYLGERFDRRVLELVLSKKDAEDYYLRMGIAWFLATALAKQYENTVWILEQGLLPAWLHRKTIQKAVESRRISPEQKAYLRGLSSLEKISRL